MWTKAVRSRYLQLAECFEPTTLSHRSNHRISKRQKCRHALFTDERFSHERSEQTIASISLKTRLREPLGNDVHRYP